MNKGPMFLERTADGHYEGTQSVMERRQEQMALDGMTSFALAQELLRRVAFGMH